MKTFHFRSEDGVHNLGFQMRQDLLPSRVLIDANHDQSLVYVGFVDHEAEIAFAFVVHNLPTANPTITHLYFTDKPSRDFPPPDEHGILYAETLEKTPKKPKEDDVDRQEVEAAAVAEAQRLAEEAAASQDASDESAANVRPATERAAAYEPETDPFTNDLEAEPRPHSELVEGLNPGGDQEGLGVTGVSASDVNQPPANATVVDPPTTTTPAPRKAAKKR